MMNTMSFDLVEYDDQGNVVSVQPVVAYIANTPEELAALLDAAEAEAN